MGPAKLQLWGGVVRVAQRGGGGGVESISISRAELLTPGQSSKQTMVPCFLVS